MALFRLIQTDQGSDARLSEREPVALERDGWPGATVIDIDTACRYQQIEGFGGAFTEAAAASLERVAADDRQRVLQAYFDPEDGLGYSLCRTHINSCDFSLGNWSCTPVADDGDLASFSLERSERHLLPLIRDAQAVPGASFKLLASPWSPPAWMKTNGEMNHGGQLKTRWRDAWARHYCRWMAEVEATGIPVWGLTVQNEPDATQTWDSCRYNAAEEAAFIRDHLGPALHGAGYAHKKLLCWDHNRDELFRRGNAILSDPDVRDYVWGCGFHWYSGDQFENVSRLHHAHPDKHLLFTEGCWEGGVKLGQWDRGERYAHHIIGDLNHFCEGWIDWNMVLDETGGPNHVGNLCDAPVICETTTGQVHYQSSFYYLGHFSRYIRPGARRLHCCQPGNGLECCAARNADGTLAVVVFNPSDVAKTAALRVDGIWAEITCPAHGIQTYLADGKPVEAKPAEAPAAQ